MDREILKLKDMFICGGGMFNSKSVHMPYKLTFAHHVLDIDNLQAVV